MGRGLSNSEVARVYRRYGHLMLRRCRVVLRDETLADDALQEAVIKLMRYGAELQQVDAKLRWLYRVTESRKSFLLEPLEATTADPRGPVPGSGEPKESAGHPDPFRLEAWSVGEPDPGVDRHMETCKECRDYVVSLEMQKEVFLDREDPDEYVRRARRAADTEQKSVGLARPALAVEQLSSEEKEAAAPEAQTPPTGEDAADRSWLSRMRWWLAGPAMAAAAVALAVVAIRMQDPRQDTGPGPRPGAGSGADPKETIRLKGPIKLGAVVTGKDKKQARVNKMVYTTAGIKLRIELTVPAPMAVSVGIVDHSGEWLPLKENKKYTPGVHYLSNTLAFENLPTTARVVAGTPEQISDALKTGNFKGLPTLLIQPVGKKKGRK